MKTFFLAVLSAVWLVGAGCSSAPPPDKSVSVVYQPGIPGGVYVESYQTPVTVLAINAATREITFRAVDDSTNTYRAEPEFVAFDRYKDGDVVKVAVVREMVTYLEGGAPPATPDLAAIVRRTPGVMPGILLSDSVIVTGTVLAVNPSQNEATLRLSDGRTVTLTVRRDIDLNRVKLGTEVTIRTASALGVLKE